MTDRELLELAAKAAGYYFCTESMGEEQFYCVPVPEKELVTNWCPIKSGRHRYEGTSLFKWNPLTDDGDALRLAVKLELSVYSHHLMINVTHTMKPFCELEIIEDQPSDPYAATRRAIVRAAAEIGKEIDRD